MAFKVNSCANSCIGDILSDECGRKMNWYLICLVGVYYISSARVAISEFKGKICHFAQCVSGRELMSSERQFVTLKTHEVNKNNIHSAI